jgi:hypothetical protein
MNDFPVDFRDQIASGKSAQPISAAALMQNYAWAKLVADDSYLQDTTLAGFPAKKLNLPPIPSGGTFVLGAEGGKLTWIATEECP